LEESRLDDEVTRSKGGAKKKITSLNTIEVSSSTGNRSVQVVEKKGGGRGLSKNGREIHQEHLIVWDGSATESR